MLTPAIQGPRARAAAAVAVAVALVIGTQTSRAQTIQYENTTFLHGTASSPVIWQTRYPALDGFTPPGYLSRQVNLRDVGAPDLNAGAQNDTVGLRYAGQRSVLGQYVGATPGRHVLVSHSAGALAARGVTQLPAVGPQGVTGIVTIAAPHQGTWLADSAQVALRYVDDMGRAIDAAKRNVNLYIATAAGLIAITKAFGFLPFVASEILTGYKLQRGGDLPTGGVGGLAAAAIINDIGPQDSAVVALNGYRGDAAIPHANVRGTIPYAHALLRLAAANDPTTSFDDLKRRKDQALSLFRNCKNMGNWLFNLSDPGNRCQRAANMLGALDAKWASWVNGTETGVTGRVLLGGRVYERRGQVPRKVPFDGVVSNERSNYPTTQNLAADLRVDGASHLNIYATKDGLNATAASMLSIGMRREDGALVASRAGNPTTPSGLPSDRIVWPAGGHRAHGVPPRP